MSNEENCSVVFIKQDEGWMPVDLKQSVADTAPEPLKTLFNRLIEASKIAEDFDLYCIFSISLDGKTFNLEGFATPGAHKEDVVIPASVSSAVLIGLSLFLGDSACCGLLTGNYSAICCDEEGNVYVKYINKKDVEQMSDKSVCVYVYDKNCRFVGSYSTVDESFINKDGKKIKLDEKSEGVVKRCFELRRDDEGEDKK